MVKIGHASISETNTINGEKGDQTGKEVCVRNWYSKPWDYMAIHPDPDVRDRHAKAVEDACNNDLIGYGQRDRNSLNEEAKKVGYRLDRISNPCNTDCSEFMNVCAVASGANVTHASNGWTTSTMKSKLEAAGYKIITDKKYLTSEAYSVRGGILVKSGSHTVCALSNGDKAPELLESLGLIKIDKDIEYYPKYTGTSKSIEDALKAVGEKKASYTDRKKIAEKNGISGYTGQPAQNTKMLTLLKQGKLRK